MLGTPYLKCARSGGADPTSTGTIWKAPPMRYIDYELSTGEEVAKLEDGRFVICMTDEILTVLS